ncbi:unnamed protein product [Heligmosomoides polygyrus]|uniref:DUF4780 domain-containing protein n=1 Tax=Heligmosomoides polygyrus TaxID=6339 RepID=A0A183GAM8_HELPZ|nr:unnamed protein product [Heligmosomoides polygyrus]
MSVASGDAERADSQGFAVAELPTGEISQRIMSRTDDLEDEFQRLCGSSEAASEMVQVASGNSEREAIEAAGRLRKPMCLPSLMAEWKEGLVPPRWVDVVMSSVYCRTREEFVDSLDEILQREEVLASIAADNKWQLEEVCVGCLTCFAQMPFCRKRC